MKERLAALSCAIEKHLYRRGFTVAGVRQVMRNQLLVTGFGCIAGLALLPFASWGVHFALGALIVTFNFYGLARFMQQAVFKEYDKRLFFSLLLRFYGRLGLTALVLFMLIAWAKVSVPALVAGLSTAVATVFVWGMAHKLGLNVKEA